MRSAITGPIVASLIAIALGACGTDGGGDDGGPNLPSYCGQFTTCGTCTPQNGCGWCYNDDGTGTCAPSPDACPTLAFSWTWDPDGCRVTAEASVVPESTATLPALPEAGTPEAGTLAPADANAPPDASSDAPYWESPGALGIQ
jgi:hypothetical protein